MKKNNWRNKKSANNSISPAYKKKKTAGICLQACYVLDAERHLQCDFLLWHVKEFGVFPSV